MKKLTMDGMGIVFNNAVVLSEKQFKELLDAINELSAQVEKLRGKECSQLENVKQQYDIHDIEMEYTDEIKKTSDGKLYVYVLDIRGRRRISAFSKKELFEKLLKFKNGELPLRKYTKRSDTALSDFESWKESWRIKIKKATGKMSFKPVYVRMTNKYGIVFEQERKEHGYKVSELLEMIYYTDSLKSLFEACAGNIVNGND